MEPGFLNLKPFLFVEGGLFNEEKGMGLGASPAMPMCPLEREIIFSTASATLQVQVPFLPTPPPLYRMGGSVVYLQWYYPLRVSGRKRRGGEEGMKRVMVKLRMEEASEAAGRVALPPAPNASRQLLPLGCTEETSFEKV